MSAHRGWPSYCLVPRHSKLTTECILLRPDNLGTRPLSLQGSPGESTVWAVIIKPRLHWRAQNVGDATTMYCLLRESCSHRVGVGVIPPAAPDTSRGAVGFEVSPARLVATTRIYARVLTPLCSIIPFLFFFGLRIEASQCSVWAIFPTSFSFFILRESSVFSRLMLNSVSSLGRL